MKRYKSNFKETVYDEDVKNAIEVVTKVQKAFWSLNDEYVWEVLNSTKSMSKYPFQGNIIKLSDYVDDWAKDTIKELKTRK